MALILNENLIREGACSIYPKVKLPILKEGFTNKLFISHAISKSHFGSLIYKNN
tara:strand:+ start:109 stop:270 length:162 start_codon:yes stop_codon:yes gene_type:complete